MKDATKNTIKCILGAILIAILFLFINFVIIPQIENSYNNTQNTNTEINTTVALPVWSASVDADIICKTDADKMSTWENISCPTTYTLTITEGTSIRKTFNEISNEKLITILTYYYINYNLNLIHYTPYIRTIDYTYIDFINENWETPEPTMKYNASEFTPEYTPAPTPAPTFNPNKWYNETIT